MCRKLICLASLVVVLSSVNKTSADLVGHWAFDEGSGNTAADNSGNGHDGTLNGDPQWVSGRLGGALEFDGANDYVGTGQSLLDNVSEFTMAGWVSARNPENSRIGLFGQNDLIEMGFMNGNVEIWTAMSGTTNTPWTFPNDTWHHIAVVSEGTSMNIYLDGELAATGSGAASYGTSSFSFNIGGGGIWDAGGNWFSGMIDDVQLYDHALTAEEIPSIMLGLEKYPYASSPNPADGASIADTWVTLTWRAGDFAVSHDVYFGENFDDVSNGTGDTFQSSQTETSFTVGLPGFPYPDGLVPGTTYYWRIDEFDGTATYRGRVWSFTAVPFISVKKGPYLIYPGDNTQMTVLWQLEMTTDCTLEWGTDTNYGNSVTSSEYGSDHQHRYTITGLTPGAKYYYQVGVDGNYLTGSFLAAPAADAQNVKFLAYGDTRTNSHIHDAVNAEMIVTYTADPAYQTFTMLTGDWVDNGDSEADWTNQFFDRSWSNMMEMQANLPINGCIGNHDGAGRVFEKYWPYPYESGGLYWSFDYGPAHIVVIELAWHPDRLSYAQKAWLEDDLAASTKEWKFLQFHSPIYSAGVHPNSTSEQVYIQSLCEMYGVDAVFCGHNHYYARAMVNGVAHITTGGGGAGLSRPQDGYPHIVASDKSHHFCKIDIQGKQLTFEAVRLDGTLIDTFTMSHFVDPITSHLENFEAGDFSRFSWEHAGDNVWTVRSSERHSGRYSAQAGSIDHDESTTLWLIRDCAAGNITFYRKVSSERGCDYLRFYIDGAEEGKWSGQEDWTEVSFVVTAGTRTFEWVYSKDGSVSEGNDTAWIDDIIFPMGGTTEPTGMPFRRGVNLGDWFGYMSSVRRIQFTKFTKQDLINIKSLGCDVIRLPIELYYMTNGEPDYTIDPLFYYFLDQIIDWAEELELHLILDNYSSNPGPTDPSIVDILVPVWMQMAEHYKDRSTYIYYEILNEPHEISDTKWNEIQQNVINSIRAVDQKHTIIVGPAGYNSYNNLKFMPDYEDDNLIYTFHFYDPFLFTHQGASWVSLEPLAGVPFPYDAARMPDCPPELENTWISSNLADYRNTGTVEHVRKLIDIAVDFKTARDIPLFCGEFGVYMPNSNNEDRIYWHNVVRSYFEEKGIAWTLSDYKDGFGLFEQGTSELFDYDLNIPLVEALGLNAPPQQEFILVSDVNEFDIYLDYIAPNIIESSWISNGLLDFYSEDNPASGVFCIHWTGADPYNIISFRFSPVKDLSVLVDEGFAIDFWVRCNSPSARINIGFVDTKKDERGDIPWYILYTIDRDVADWNGQWNHLQIPLNAFFETGSYYDDRWYNPVGAFDWTATEHFQITAEYNDLVGIHFYFDDIRVVNPGPEPRKPSSARGFR